MRAFGKTGQKEVARVGQHAEFGARHCEGGRMAAFGETDTKLRRQRRANTEFGHITQVVR
jgi:hypothetical protein